MWVWFFLLLLLVPILTVWKLSVIKHCSWAFGYGGWQLLKDMGFVLSSGLIAVAGCHTGVNADCSVWWLDEAWSDAHSCHFCSFYWLLHPACGELVDLGLYEIWLLGQWLNQFGWAVLDVFLAGIRGLYGHSLDFPLSSHNLMTASLGYSV